MRRLLIMVVYVTQYMQVLHRTYGIGVLCFAVVLSHILVWPFQNQQDNMLEAVSLAVLTYAAFTKSSYPGLFVCVCVCVCQSEKCGFLFLFSTPLNHVLEHSWLNLNSSKIAFGFRSRRLDSACSDHHRHVPRRGCASVRLWQTSPAENFAQELGHGKAGNRGAR